MKKMQLLGLFLHESLLIFGSFVDKPPCKRYYGRSSTILHCKVWLIHPSFFQEAGRIFVLMKAYKVAWNVIIKDRWPRKINKFLADFEDKFVVLQDYCM